VSDARLMLVYTVQTMQIKVRSSCDWSFKLHVVKASASRFIDKTPINFARKRTGPLQASKTL
jgi:hypothetical protein